MKRTALLGLLFLAVAMSAPVLAQQGNRTQTASHEITGVLEGTFTFVALPYTNNSEFATLGVVSGVVKDLGRSNMFTYHRHTTIGMEDGLVRIVAANGDIIRGQYTGDVVWGTPIIGTATVDITGGTGRFANASGTISLTAYVTMVDGSEWPVTWGLEETINY